MSGLWASIFLGQFLSLLFACPFIQGEDVRFAFSAGAVFASVVLLIA